MKTLKKSPTNGLYREIMLWVMILVVSVLGLNLASAWTTNQFNNSLTTESISIAANQNITRYLSIPNSVSVLTWANLNLTGTGSGGLAEYEKYVNAASFNMFMVCDGLYNQNVSQNFTVGSVGTNEDFILDRVEIHANRTTQPAKIGRAHV